MKFKPATLQIADPENARAYFNRPKAHTWTRPPAARRWLFLEFGWKKNKPDARVSTFYDKK